MRADDPEQRTGHQRAEDFNTRRALARSRGLRDRRGKLTKSRREEQTFAAFTPPASRALLPFFPEAAEALGGTLRVRISI